MSWLIPKADGELRKVYGLLKVDWHCQDFRQFWNHMITSHYMMAQGVTYGVAQFNPKVWRGLVDFHQIWKIERFPRKDFEMIR
jgi:hypothetical protein